MDKELLSSINKYLANLAVEYFKLHNLHWNVVGINFKSTHEYLEVLYDGITKTLDEVAEVIKMKGECPLVSLNEYLSNATIEELKCKEVKSDVVFKIVLKDFNELKSNCEEIRRFAMEEDEYEIITMIEDNLKEFNKSIWFINSSLK